MFEVPLAQAAITGGIVGITGARMGFML